VFSSGHVGRELTTCVNLSEKPLLRKVEGQELFFVKRLSVWSCWFGNGLCFYEATVEIRPV
jgi:hypothetical protein